MGKFKKLGISRNEFSVERTYYVGSDKVKNIETEVDHGVCMDSELNFNEERNLRIKKANSMVGAIRRSFVYLDAYTFVKLYKSMVRCHLENAVPVWFPYLVRDIEVIEAVQKRATKMLSATKRME